MIALWDIASCGLLEIYRVSKLHTASIVRVVIGGDDDEGSMYLKHVR